MKNEELDPNVKELFDAYELDFMEIVRELGISRQRLQASVKRQSLKRTRCIHCGVEELKSFDHCKKCYNKLKKAETSKRYEKTPNGYLMRTYRNMKSRVKGILKHKSHLYEGKDLLEKEVFYDWAKSSDEFMKLFEAYKASEWDMKLAPSVNRIDSTQGYILSNMEWLTHSENSADGSKSRHNMKSP